MKRVLVFLGAFMILVTLLALTTIKVSANDDEEMQQVEEVEEQPQEEQEVNDDEFIDKVVNALEEIEKKKGFWEVLKDKFTPETITSIVSILTLLGALLKLISANRKLKADELMNLATVQETLKQAMGKEIADKISEGVNTIVNPLVNKVSKILPVLETFSKVLVLSQEDTPESKVSILNLIQALGQVDQEVVEEAKAEIENQVKVEEEKKAETVENLKKMIVPVE